MSEENKKVKLNLWRRGSGLLLGLMPLLLIIASIVYGLARSPQPKFAAVGWMIAAGVFAALNFFLSFIRPPFLLYVLRIPKQKYKHVSGLPMIGSILLCLGIIFSFGSIGSALLGLICFAFDTGGSVWFLIATWKDSSLWDSPKI
jgi:hypothetical protein